MNEQGKATPTELDGYKILHLLDEGSMALVYVAEGPDGQRYAVKTFFVTPDMTANERKLLFEAIRREGKILQQLDHPNIVKVKALRADDDSGTAYIVMELVEGGTIAKSVEHSGLPEFGVVKHWLRQVASALDYFHQYSVHRDVKPSNMLLSPSGLDVKLADFGIAKSTAGLSTSMGSTLFPQGKPGTPYFRAPEQIISPREVDGKADQWGLAVSAYYMLTGGVPFEGEDIDQVNAKIIQSKQPSACLRNRELPKAVDRVFERALAKSPLKRYGSCGEFVDALSAALEGKAAGGGAGRGLKVAALVLATAGLLAAGMWGIGKLMAPPDPAVDSEKSSYGSDSSKTTASKIVTPKDLTPTKSTATGKISSLTPPVPKPLPPPPPPPPACKPHYKLNVELMEKSGTGEHWTNVTTIPNASFGKTDPRYGYLGAGELRARVTESGCPVSAIKDSLAVSWVVDDLPTNVPARPDATGAILVPYEDVITKGSYQVKLLVNKDPVDGVSFTIRD